MLVYPFLRVYENPIHYFLLFTTLIFIAALIEEPEIRRYFTTYWVTNDEVMKMWGIIRKNKISIPYSNVTSVNYFKGILGRIFNFGDVTVNSSSGDIKMKGVKNPEEIVRIIENKISLMTKRVRERKKRT